VLPEVSLELPHILAMCPGSMRLERFIPSPDLPQPIASSTLAFPSSCFSQELDVDNSWIVVKEVIGWYIP